jgi:hypothetical protein
VEDLRRRSTPRTARLWAFNFLPHRALIWNGLSSDGFAW